MIDFIDYITNKYEEVKLYIILIPYYNEIRSYFMNPYYISIYTYEHPQNSTIYTNVKTFFPTKLVSVETVKNQFVEVSDIA